MTSNKLLLTCAILMCMTLFQSEDTLADEAIISLPKASEIKHAKLAFYPLSINTYAPVTESEILSNGCVFEIEEGSEQLTQLTQILEPNIVVSHKGNQNFNIRNVIYLELMDESIVRLIISDAHNVQPGVFGIIGNKKNSSEGYITSNENMLKILRSWARKNIPVQNSSTFC